MPLRFCIYFVFDLPRCAHVFVRAQCIPLLYRQSLCSMKGKVRRLVLVTLLITVTGYRTKATEGRRALFLLTVAGCSPSWRVNPGRRSLTRLLTLHPELGSRKQRMFVFIFYFHLVWDTIACGIALPTFRVSLPTPINQI